MCAGERLRGLLYERTYLTAKLFLATSKAYFGYRSYLNDSKSDEIKRITQESLTAIDMVCKEINDYPHKEPHGQYIWIDDLKKS